MAVPPLLIMMHYKNNMHSSCEIEDFVETHFLQAVCDTYSDRAYHWVCVLMKDFFFFFSRTFTFRLLDMPWSQVSSLLLPGSCLHFLSRTGLSNLTVDISSSVANSRSRASRKSICVQEKVPTSFIRVCARGDSNSRN